MQRKESRSSSWQVVRGSIRTEPTGCSGRSVLSKVGSEHGCEAQAGLIDTSARCWANPVVLLIVQALMCLALP
jgi:hypothetical protein